MKSIKAERNTEMSIQQSVPLEKQLMYRVEHRLPGFERLYELGTTDILAFQQEDCRSWHGRFTTRIFDALGRNVHLPVYRISHGEFIMAVGNRLVQGASLKRRFLHYSWLVRQRLGLAPAFYSGSNDNTWETFNLSEIKRARDMYKNYLREIARDGLLAVALNEDPGFSAYLKPYLSWLDLHGIALNRDNYFPFYSVYALLFGEDSGRLFGGKNTLVITSFTQEKRSAIEAALKKKGANSVQCYHVSPSKAMFDIVDLARIRQPVDLILIGAGVGSASIQHQVKPLGAVAIDAGFALDALVFPELRWNRPFCVSDNEFDPAKVRFVNHDVLEDLKKRNVTRGRSNAAIEMLEAKIDAKR
jgi:hypothetical protein